MADPFPSPPGTNPPRHIEQDSSNSSWGWPVGILAGFLVLGFLFFSIATPEDRTATNAAPTTTGQADRARARPLPANPNATTPQRDPAQPAPAPAPAR
jgi:hypothetical protein